MFWENLKACILVFILPRVIVMDVRQQPDNSYQVFKNKMRVALDCHYLRTGEVKPVLLTGLQSSLCVFRELSRGPLCLPHAGNSVCGWYSEG